MTTFIEILKNFFLPLIVGIILLFISKKVPHFRVKKDIDKKTKSKKKIKGKVKINDILFLASLVIIGISIGFLIYFITNNIIFQKTKSVEIDEKLDEMESTLVSEIITEEEYNFSIIGNCNTPGQANSIFVDGDYAYIADFENGLQIINIIDKENPKIVGNCDIDGESIDVFVEGNYAYVLVSDINDKFSIINIENKEEPKIINFYEFEYSVNEIMENYSDENNRISRHRRPDVNDIIVSNNTAYIVDNVGLKIFDIKNKNNIEMIGNCDTFYFAEGIYIEGDYAYIADYTDGVQIIDIKEKDNPVIIGMVDTDGEAYNLYVDKQLVYIADGSKGVSLAYIKNKNSYFTNKSISFNFRYVKKIVKDEEYLLALTSNDIEMIRIEMNNIFEFSDCRIVGKIIIPGEGEDIFLQNGIIYVANSVFGLQIITIEKNENINISD